MESNPSWPVLELFGIVAFALSGISVAKTAKLDIVGTYFCALVTALGGGTVRDVLINHRPFYWVANEWLLLLLFILVACSYAPRLQHFYGPFTILTCAADAVGTGTFAMNGLLLALEAGFGSLAALLMSLITALVGSVLRDITCAQIPHVFKRTELCATCVLGGCFAYFGALAVGITFHVAYVFGVICAGVSRYFALTKSWRLPW